MRMDSQGCRPSPGNITDAKASLLSVGTNEQGFHSKHLSNDTVYDLALTRVVPLITAVWLKGNSSISSSTGWSEVRLTCMEPKTVTAGNRQPKGVPDLPSLGIKTLNEGVAALVISVVLMGVLL